MKIKHLQELSSEGTETLIYRHFYVATLKQRYINVD